MQAAGTPLEIVFVSGDNSEEEFSEYFASMPWLALPFGDKRIDQLNSHFEVSGIPTLILTDPSGKTLRDDMRNVIDADPKGEGFPWPRKALNSLEGSMGTINEVPTLAIFTDGSKEQEEQAKQALEAVAAAEDAHAQAHDGEFRTMFTYSGEGEDDAANSIRGFLKLTSASVPLVVLIDIPNKKKFVLDSAAGLTADAISAFLTSVQSGSAVAKGVRD